MPVGLYAEPSSSPLLTLCTKNVSIRCFHARRAVRYQALVTARCMAPCAAIFMPDSDSYVSEPAVG